MGNSVSKSLVMWSFPLFQVSAMGDPLVTYRDTNIPCYLGCCFEVLSFAAYPGYPLVPYRDTNIPCYLGWCFEGTIFCSVTWVARAIRASDMPPYPRRIMPATQATRSISYLEQEFRQIKWPRVIVSTLPYVISLHTKRSLHAKCCMFKRKVLKARGFLCENRQSQ